MDLQEEISALREIIQQQQKQIAALEARAPLADPTEAECALTPKLTAAVREADQAFETVGGSSRHYVRDCLLPALAKAGLKIVDVE
jgi:hypothetical protein